MQTTQLKKIYASILTIIIGGFCSLSSNTAYSVQPANIKKTNINRSTIHKIDKNLPLPKNASIYKNNINEFIYEVLVSEFVAQSSPKSIVNNYLELAKKYQQSWFAERATQIAIDENDFKTANIAVKIWEKYINPQDKYNLYRTILYINSQVKDFNDTKNLTLKWLQTIPNDKLSQELLMLPSIIDTTNPILSNEIADILNQYTSLEGKLARAKILLKAKQNKGQELINELQKQYPDNQNILLAWLSSISVEQRIEFLSNYIKNFSNSISSSSVSQNIQKNQIQNLIINLPQNKQNNDTNDGDTQTETLSLRKANLLLLTTYFASGQFDNGIKYGEAILPEYKDDTDIAFLLAQFYRVQKQPEKAYSTLMNLLESNKKLPITMYLFLADISKEMNKYEQAAYWLEQTESNEAKIIQNIALLYIQASKFDKAYNFYTILRSKIQEDRKQEFDTVLLQLWLTTKQWNYALEILEKLIIDNPQKVNLYSIRSDIYLFINDFKNAQADLKKVLNLGNIEPSIQANAYNSLAYIYASQNKNLDLAYEYANKAINYDSSNYAYQDTIGWVLYKQNKLDKARKWLEQSWNTKQDIDTGNHLGEVLVVLGEKDLAQIIWQQAKKLENSNQDSLDNLQKTLKKFGIPESQ